jgi:hypothetical protein
MRITSITVAALCASFAAAPAEEPPGKARQHPGLAVIHQIPDMVQTDPMGKFARGGRSYCGPVAASNSLVWLKAGRNEPFHDNAAQCKVVNLLASPEYMNTHPVKGVGAVGLIRGVKRFVENDIGDQDFQLSYQGWRSSPKGHFTGVKTPELDWIRSFVGPGKSAWINLGWYRHNKARNEYERIGGHWVTVVGHGADRNGRPNDHVIVIHDPSPRTGKDPHDFVVLRKLAGGTLTGNGSGLPRPAKGLFLMGGGMHIKSSADVAILDGIVGLDLHPAKSR